jgi:hypothetical protein
MYSHPTDKWWEKLDEWWPDDDEPWEAAKLSRRLRTSSIEPLDSDLVFLYSHPSVFAERPPGDDPVTSSSNDLLIPGDLSPPSRSCATR